LPRPRRRSPRLEAYDYAAEGAYFVTVCSVGRACIFGRVLWDAMQQNATARIVEACWREIPSHYPGAGTDAFVVMPNHVHGILWLARAGHAPPLPRVVSSFKAAASRQAGRPLWQRSFYDRIIRNDGELLALRQYVRDNPLRWALDHENPARAGS
jgi:putative transposase